MRTLLLVIMLLTTVQVLALGSDESLAPTHASLYPEVNKLLKHLDPQLRKTIVTKINSIPLDQVLRFRNAGLNDDLIISRQIEPLVKYKNSTKAANVANKIARDESIATNIGFDEKEKVLNKQPNSSSDRVRSSDSKGWNNASPIDDDNRIYLATDEGNIYRWTIGGKVELLLDTDLRLRGVAFDPSGLMYAVTPDSLYSVDPVAGRVSLVGELLSEQETYPGSGTRIWSANGFDISPKGLALITTENTYLVGSVDLSSGKVEPWSIPFGQGGRRREQGGLWFINEDRYAAINNSSIDYIETTHSEPVRRRDREYDDIFWSGIIGALVASPVRTSDFSEGTLISFSADTAYPVLPNAVPFGPGYKKFNVQGAISGATVKRYLTFNDLSAESVETQENTAEEQSPEPKFPGNSYVYKEFSTRFVPFDRFLILDRFNRNKEAFNVSWASFCIQIKKSDQDIVTLLTDMLKTTASLLNLTLDEFKLLNDGRNMHQAVSIAYLDLTKQKGWSKAPAWKSRFHTIGLEISEVEKWVNTDGREYVFILIDGKPFLVNDGVNDGTFNYGIHSLSSAHFGLDIFPWARWGVGPQDRQTVLERINQVQDARLICRQ